MIQPPAVFGHEVVGEVAAVGKRVDARWRIGLRVVAANPRPACAAITVVAPRKISARICSSTTVPTPSICASPAASSWKTCWRYRTPSMTAAPHWSSRWHACSAESTKWKSAQVTPRGHRLRPDRSEVRPDAFTSWRARNRPRQASRFARTCPPPGRGCHPQCQRRQRSRCRGKGPDRRSARRHSVVEAAGNPATWNKR